MSSSSVKYHWRLHKQMNNHVPAKNSSVLVHHGPSANEKMKLVTQVIVIKFQIILTVCVTDAKFTVPYKRNCIYMQTKRKVKLSLCLTN
jgi:hypothetical protein